MVLRVIRIVLGAAVLAACGPSDPELDQPTGGQTSNTGGTNAGGSGGNGGTTTAGASPEGGGGAENGGGGSQAEGGSGGAPACGGGPACDFGYVCDVELCRVPVSCAELLAADPSAPSDSYTLDADEGGPIESVETYCDMAPDGNLGAGWTLVLASLDDGDPSEEVSNVETDVNVSQMANEFPEQSAKLSDVVIEALLQPSHILRVDPLDAGLVSLYLRGSDLHWSNAAGNYRFNTLEARTSDESQWTPLSGFICKGQGQDPNGCGLAGAQSDFCFGKRGDDGEEVWPRKDNDSAHYRLINGNYGKGPRAVRLWIH